MKGQANQGNEALEPPPPNFDWPALDHPTERATISGIPFNRNTHPLIPRAPDRTVRPARF
jgi:hypothetical protein